MLRTALGPSIASWLADPAIVEVMLNPAGRLWVDRLGEGLADTGERLSPADGHRIIRPVAHPVGCDIPARNPRVSAATSGPGWSEARRVWHGWGCMCRSWWYEDHKK